jgi:hypothetical protein
MSCCGQSRRQAPTKIEGSMIKPPMRRTIQFEYTGRTALNVVGPVSGVQYRFGRPGARVTVDARDAAAFARMPILTKSPGAH